MKVVDCRSDAGERWSRRRRGLILPPMMGVGEMSERECWGRDEGDGYFGLKGCFMVNVDRNIFGGLR